MYAPPVQRLITELSRLPGVGGRTAQRLAFHLLRAREEEAVQVGEPAISGEELVRRFMEEFDAEEILEDDPEEMA